MRALQRIFFAYQYAGAVQDNCYKLEISNRFGICIAATDLSSVVLSQGHMRSCLNQISLIYERCGCNFGDFQWGFSENIAFPALSLSERLFPVVWKAHLIFQGTCGTYMRCSSGY